MAESGENPVQVHSVYPTTQYPGQKKIYVPQNKREMLAAIEKALTDDGSSFSGFVLELLEKWWNRHKPGNPQLHLDQYDPSIEPQPGPGIPGSIHYKDRQEVWHWGWLHELPFDKLFLVKKDGKTQYVVLDLQFTTIEMKG